MDTQAVARAWAARRREQERVIREQHAALATHAAKQAELHDEIAAIVTQMGNGGIALEEGQARLQVVTERLRAIPHPTTEG